VRRSVRPERSGDDVLRGGLSDYDLAILPDDPLEQRSERLPIPEVRVPPITLFEEDALLSREASRARLGLPLSGRFVLVCSGGGGDPEGRAAAARAAEAIARLPEGPTPVLAEGPLARGGRAVISGVLTVREVPLQPLLAAFDGAVAAAGYNLAHELAKAGVPAALFSQPRPFDDQAGRSARFAAAGLARALRSIDDRAIAEAIAWMERAPRPSIEAGGADRAADALLELAACGKLATGGRPVTGSKLLARRGAA
jgi:predicted glycosyltransferase